MKHFFRYLRLFLITTLGILSFYVYNYRRSIKKTVIEEYVKRIQATTNSTLREADKESTWTTKWPRVNFANCSHREYMNKGINSPEIIENSPIPRTGLVSTPGCGNTWTRHLIEQATGLWTGSVYHDEQLYQGGLDGEFEKCRTNSTIVIKAHQPRHAENCRFDRVILLVRDLNRAFLSEFNRRSSGSHVGVADSKVFPTKRWTNMILKDGIRLMNLNINWIELYVGDDKKMKNTQNPFIAPANFWKNLLLVSYERLKKDSVEELRRIITFLKLPVFREHCLQKNSEGEFRRQESKSQTSLACFYDKPEIRQKMNQTIQQLLSESIKLGSGNIIAEFEEIFTADSHVTCKNN
ncbi:sialate:O-sulfotransferase 1-like [Styela clava]